MGVKCHICGAIDCTWKRSVQNRFTLAEGYKIIDYPNTTPKKESTVSVVTITKHTAEANARRIRRAERELKNANAGTSKTRVEVSAHTYADEPYASLYVQVPGESDREDGQYASVVMNVADLEALETAVFNARKAVVKATESKVVRVAEMKL